MKVFYVQPLVPSYRREVVDTLAREFVLTVLSDMKHATKNGFVSGLGSYVEVVDCPMLWSRRFGLGYQKGVIGRLVRDRPNVVLAAGNPRDISYWFMLVVAKCLGVKVVSHSQGPFKAGQIGWLRCCAYKCITFLSDRVVLYNKYALSRFVECVGPSRKLSVAENSLSLSATVAPSERSGLEMGILFVGRLRAGCNLELLVEAALELRKAGVPVTVEVVGGGELEAEYRERFKESWINWHGMLYDHQAIAEVSRACRVGCYPGSAGLSVVHMFGLALPPIVESDVGRHMGPEPAYVVDGVNGFLFSGGNEGSGLKEVLMRAFSLEPQVIRRLSEGARMEYDRLTMPPLGVRLKRVIEQVSPSGGAC